MYQVLFDPIPTHLDESSCTVKCSLTDFVEFFLFVLENLTEDKM